jgi:thymidine kinase
MRWVEEKGLYVIVSGLDGTFERKPFGQLPSLIPLCDEYLKLKGICKICAEQHVRSDSLFSLRIEGGNSEIEIGSDDKYSPVCRYCYLKYNKK